MITANKIPIAPTIFPDGTSQVWRLPRRLRDAYDVSVTWDFEYEREIWDLVSLRRLLYSHPMNLHMPYLPFARQDKRVSNARTFNLEVFADLINPLRFGEVTSIDVHNPRRTRSLIKNFRNVEPREFHRDTFNAVSPDLVVFPDAGAAKRYDLGPIRSVTLGKARNKVTGEILSLTCEGKAAQVVERGKRALIIDDICDGGATFIKAAQCLKEIQPRIDVHLAVTHGIFSRGVEPLTRAGITVHCHRFFKLPRAEE